MNKPKTETELVQGAELLAVSPQIIYGLVRRKKIRPLAGFGRLRFSAAELARFVATTR